MDPLQYTSYQRREQWIFGGESAPKKATNIYFEGLEHLYFLERIQNIEKHYTRLTTER